VPNGLRRGRGARTARLVAMLQPAVLGGVEGIRGERRNSPEQHPKMRRTAPAPAHRIRVRRNSS
jgi:hypothetical protein